MNRRKPLSFGIKKVGATHIIYHVPVPASQNILHRLAEEVALPLQTEYQ